MSSTGENDSVLEVLEYLEKMSENKLKDERKREESIILQASHMQTAFSFSTAALFMVAAIIYEYRGGFSFCYLFVVFASITACLLCSLVFATIAQNRMETTVFLDIRALYKKVENDYNSFRTQKLRKKYYIESCAEAQNSLAANNEERVKWLRYSMRAFYVSIVVCIIWVVVSIIKMNMLGGN